MAGKKNERPMTADERAALEQVLAQSGAARRWKAIVGTFSIAWFLLTGAFLILWWLASWLGRSYGYDFGPNSAVAFPVLLGGIVVAAALAAAETVRWVRTWKNGRQPLAADLAGGVVVEETMEFNAAKRFQEPEHGGLIYCMRTTDDRVFVLYDHESQDLGVAGKDPLQSSFRVRRELRIARAPASRLVLARTFNGPDIEAVVAAGELAVPPERWPEEEEFCRIAWHNLERRLGKAA